MKTPNMVSNNKLNIEQHLVPGTLECGPRVTTNLLY